MLKIILSLVFLLSSLIVVDVRAEDNDEFYTIANEDEVIQYNATIEPESSRHTFLHRLLMWIPNRILDVWDILRFDVGVGPAFGGVVRVSKYGQAAFRGVAPMSVRVGDFGREVPFMIETSNEIALGPDIVKSRDRKVCIGEIGAGADVLLAGAYGGVCLDEVVDFVAGFFFLDVSDDDL